METIKRTRETDKSLAEIELGEVRLEFTDHAFDRARLRKPEWLNLDVTKNIPMTITAGMVVAVETTDETHPRIVRLTVERKLGREETNHGVGGTLVLAPAGMSVNDCWKVITIF